MLQYATAAVGGTHYIMLPLPCNHHASSLSGLLQITIQEGTWFSADAATTYTSQVPREQLPITPMLACLLYGLEGITADPGLVAHWTMRKIMTEDVKWLLVYVVLSRVRSVDCLVSFGLTDYIVGQEPPKYLIGSFDHHFSVTR